MQPRAYAGLDNPVFTGRVRDYTKRPSFYAPRPVKRQIVSDIIVPRQVSQVPQVVKVTHKPNHLNRKVERTYVLRREIVTKPVKRQRKQVVTKTRLLMGMAVLLFMLGAGVSLQTIRQNQQTGTQVKALAAQASVSANGPDLPDETKPAGSVLSDYHVAADLPRFLTISKLGIQARVKRMGVKADNSLQAPPNIYDAGWYDGSAKPGEAGAMLLDGHVHGPTQPGVFMNLKKLVAGDTIQVERGDGKVMTYKVVTTKTYDVNNVDMAAALSPVVAGKPGLNLMTCAGKYDAAAKEYRQRLVVFTVQG